MNTKHDDAELPETEREFTRETGRLGKFTTGMRERRKGGGRRKNDPKPDHIIDKCLAYFAFAVLIFTASSIFMPTATGQGLSLADAAISLPAKMTAIPDQPRDWSMRGRND